MTDKRFKFYQKWLTLSNVIAVIVGLLVALAGDSIVLEIHNSQTKEVFFASNEFSEEVLLLKKWLFGIIGGTIVGFHVLMVLISENAFKRKEKWAYNALWLAMLTWFFIDSGLSLYFGALHNVLLINIPAFIMIVFPLVMTRREFYRKKPH